MQDVIVNVNAVQGKEEDRKIKRHVCAGESLIVLGASAQRNASTRAHNRYRERARIFGMSFRTWPKMIGCSVKPQSHETLLMAHHAHHAPSWKKRARRSLSKSENVREADVTKTGSFSV